MIKLKMESYAGSVLMISDQMPEFP